jgi:hypothetical protein
MTMSRINPCPTREAIEHFRRGLLPETELERLAEHLATCPECAGQLESASADDPILATLRRSVGEAPLPDEHESANVAARVRGWEELGRPREPAAAGDETILTRVSLRGVAAPVSPQPTADRSPLHVLLFPALAAALALLALAIVLALIR